MDTYKSVFIFIVIIECKQPNKRCSISVARHDYGGSNAGPKLVFKDEGQEKVKIV